MWQFFTVHVEVLGGRGGNLIYDWWGNKNRIRRAGWTARWMHEFPSLERNDIHENKLTSYLLFYFTFHFIPSFKPPPCDSDGGSQYGNRNNNIRHNSVKEKQGKKERYIRKDDTEVVIDRHGKWTRLPLAGACSRCGGFIKAGWELLRAMSVSSLF